MTESKTESQPTYAPSYKVIDHCLLETKNSKQGPYDKKLCNFMPWITSEVTLDDGAQTTTRIRLKGIHQSGRELPEIEIPADELGNFNWVAKHWGINCILEVGQNVKDSLRYAIQTTAESADHQTVYAVTGWKKINGTWEFLMPGADDVTVHLPGKMQGYRMEQEYDYLDVQVVSCLMQFQPTLYRLISLLSTRKELEQMQVRQRQLLQAEKQDTLTTIRSTLQQDGKMREQFSTDTSKMLSDSLKAMEDTAQRLEQRIMKKVARASILSVVLSVLACGVLLHLVS